MAGPSTLAKPIRQITSLPLPALRFPLAHQSRKALCPLHPCQESPRRFSTTPVTLSGHNRVGTIYLVTRSERLISCHVIVTTVEQNPSQKSLCRLCQIRSILKDHDRTFPPSRILLLPSSVALKSTQAPFTSKPRNHRKSSSPSALNPVLPPAPPHPTHPRIQGWRRRWKRRGLWDIRGGMLRVL